MVQRQYFLITKRNKKGTQVKRMFDSIAETYDQLNHTLSFGIDKIWRRKGIAFLRPFSPKTILDIATGTGDLAISMYKSCDPTISSVPTSR